MASIVWGHELAQVYDRTYAAKFEPSAVDPMVAVLADLARGGAALELAVGTGRVALPLSAAGISVHGLELSPHMAAQLAAKPGADVLPVTIGDMTTTQVAGAPFRLVYLVANTIMNVTTQDDQVAVFANAAGQVAWSHHWMEIDGQLVRHSAPYRYVWPSELDLMAKLCGFRVCDRWAGWDRAPFTAESTSQVAIFERL